MERTPAQRDALIARLIADMDLGALFGETGNNTARDALARFSDSTLTLVESTVMWNLSQRNQRRKFMDAALTTVSEDSARELMFCIQLINCDLNSHEAFTFITGLRRLDHFRNTPRLDELTGDDLLIATAFLNITAAIWEHTDAEEYLSDNDGNDGDEYAEWIKDPELQGIIVQNPEAAEMIISYIRERGSVNADGIRNCLHHAAPLREGAI